MADYRERVGSFGVWQVGRAAKVVLIDPVSGRAGQVVHVRGDSDLESVDVLAPDVVSWLEAFTTWAEQEVPTVEREVAEEDTEDDEQREELLVDYLADGFATWLAETTISRNVKVGEASES